VIAERALPWHVTRIGCRAEYLFQPTPPRTGGEAAARKDPKLDAFVHLYLLNRGVLMTPFHNMALMSPATTEADVDRHTEVFAAAPADLEGPSHAPLHARDRGTGRRHPRLRVRADPHGPAHAGRATP